MFTKTILKHFFYKSILKVYEKNNTNILDNKFLTKYWKELFPNAYNLVNNK